MSTQFNDMNKGLKGKAKGRKLKFKTYPNAMPATQDIAPFLGRMDLPTAKVQDDVVERMVKNGCYLGKAEINRILDGMGFCAMDSLQDEPGSKDLGFVRLYPAMAGGFDTADAEFDPERNRIYIAAVPCEEIRNALADCTASQDNDGARMQIIKVTWGDGEATNEIKSGEPFDIYFAGITRDVGDEFAELVLPDGTSVPIELDPYVPEADALQRASGRLMQTVAACEGAKVVIHTHGRDRESGLKAIPSSKITILAGETPPEPTPPTLTEVKTDGMESGEIVWDDDIKIVGSNLALGTGGKVEAQIEDSGDSWTDLTPYMDGEASGPGLIVLMGARGSETDEGVWNALGAMELPTTEGRVRFRVTTAGGSDTIVAETVG